MIITIMLQSQIVISIIIIVQSRIVIIIMWTCLHSRKQRPQFDGHHEFKGSSGSIWGCKRWRGWKGGIARMWGYEVAFLIQISLIMTLQNQLRYIQWFGACCNSDRNSRKYCLTLETFNNKLWLNQAASQMTLYFLTLSRLSGVGVYCHSNF